MEKECSEKKIVLFSAPMKDRKNFADSELLYLFETVLEHNSRLYKNDKIDFWYELKK